MAENKFSSNSLNNDFGTLLLLQLNDFRKLEKFTDVYLICQDRKMPAHKNILAAASPYFMAMFSGQFPESLQSEIQIHEMDADYLELIINFIYTGQLNINADNVQQLLATSSFLQIEMLTNSCAEFMVAHLDAENCLGLKLFAEKHNNFMLLETVKNFIITNFKDVVQSEEFIEMAHNELVAILSQDKLFLHSDDTVLCGLVRWAAHKPDERQIHLSSLLRFIHPAFVSADVVRSLHVLQTNEDICNSQWLRDVYDCEGNMEWRIFLLDKMGNHPDVHRFDVSSKMQPKQLIALKPMPRPAFATSLAAYKNILYIQGGSTGRSTRESFYYNIYRDEWYDLQPLLIERSHHRSLILNGNLYALGGNSQDVATSSVECLNFMSNKSQFMNNMLEERASMGAVVCENALYVMGGETNDHSLHTAERYDPRDGLWQSLPPMHEVNSYCTSAVIDQRIFCCEGLGNCMECFDVRAHKWSTIDFWESNEFFEIFTVAHDLFSVSGCGISRYNFETSEWLITYKFPDLHEWDLHAVGMQMMNYCI